MGQPNFPGIGEALIVYIGRDAFRKLAEIAEGRAVSLNQDEAQAILEEIEMLEQRSPRLYRAGECPKCGSDNTNRLQNGDGECYPCGFVYEFSEPACPK